MQRRLRDDRLVDAELRRRLAARLVERLGADVHADRVQRALESDERFRQLREHELGHDRDVHVQLRLHALRLVDDDVLRHGESGQWSNAGADLQPRQLRRARESDERHRLDAGRHDVQPGATYACNTGYTLVGSASRTCQSNGDLVDSAPTCALITCNAPSNPTNGLVSYPNLNWGSSASYACNSGYYISSGSSSQTCSGASTPGTWTGSPAVCSAITCTALTNPTNGTVTSNTTWGSTATYTCNAGYAMTGSSTRSCGGDRAARHVERLGSDVLADHVQRAVESDQRHRQRPEHELGNDRDVQLQRPATRSRARRRRRAPAR